MFRSIGGRESPARAMVALVIAPSAQYRWSDSLLFDLGYAAIFGGFVQTSFFRDRDQVSSRVTFLLN